MVGLRATTERIEEYYRKSDYLLGPLRGTCHFGFTNVGHQFNLHKDLLQMEMLLGEKIAQRSGSKILDAGCGFGRVAKTLAERFGYKIFGVDLMQERLDESRVYLEENHQSQRTNLTRGNYGQLPFNSSSFSGIYTMETLCHAYDLEGTLEGFKTVLEPGGRLVLFEYSIPEISTMNPVNKFIATYVINKTGMASIHRFTHGTLAQIVEDAGFKNVTYEDIRENVWPTWHWLFNLALQQIGSAIMNGKIKDSVNLQSSYVLWPYRHNLGYSVITANKD